MIKKKNISKKWILRISLVLLCYPFAEFLTPVNLGGSISRGSLTTTVEPLTVESFMDGSFQESFTKYINDQIGLFGFFVKTHNQIEYSLFGNIYTGKIVAGKNNYLFEQAYIDSYYGKDFIGMPKIEKYSNVIKELQDSLEAMDKLLVFALATGKASYYPEHLPYTEEKDSTISEFLINEFNMKDINHIDYTPYFLELKNTYGDLMFPKYGVHWSHFSNLFVADTLVKFVENKTNWDLPNIHIQNYNYSTTTDYFDNDIANSMNLFQTLQPDSMSYPDFVWDKPNGDPKKVLLIGDSFGWDIFENFRLGEDCFDEMQFWFYNQIINKNTKAEGRVDDGLPLLTRHINLYSALKEFDVFVVLSNEPNLARRGWGFPRDALLTLKDSSYVRENRNNDYLRTQCTTKKAWRDDLQELADKRGKTFEEMVEIYLLDQEFKLD